MAQYQLSGLYKYNGSLVGLDVNNLDNVLGLSFIGSSFEAPISATISDADGTLTASDTDSTIYGPFGNEGAFTEADVNYLGGGTISGTLLDTRAVSIMVINGEVYFYMPDGIPTLGFLAFSLGSGFITRT